MKSFKLLFLIIFLSGTFMNCNKTDFSCPDDDEFCSLINAENYGKAIDITDEFVALFDKNLIENEKLAKIKVWLKCKSCVANAEILCNSCIYTYPPKSEIKIWFEINREVKIKIMDVLISEPLKIIKFHD